MKQDGIFTGCYIHFDGYPTGAGRALLEDFNTADKVTRLIKLGMVEAVKLGGFITEWENKSDAHATFGATIEEVVAKSAAYHVYFFNGTSWTHDKVAINPKSFRRVKKWKFKGKPLSLAIISYQKTLAENARR
jgi:hypothetical protein